MLADESLFSGSVEMVVATGSLGELKMLDEKDFLNLQLRVTQGLREQLKR